MPNTASVSYPSWKFYPSRSPAPAWVSGVVDAFSAAESEIDSRSHHGITSDAALAALRPGLVELGFEIERGKSKAEKIWRPVLFGDEGRSRVSYEVDGFHREHGVVLEVEAGRGAANNADYRDLIRASLMVDADYLVLAMMLKYVPGKVTMRSYHQTRERIDAVYASERLKLPLKGILLVGY